MRNTPPSPGLALVIRLSETARQTPRKAWTPELVRLPQLRQARIHARMAHTGRGRRLPLELCLQVIDDPRLSPQDLVACSLVCSAWHPHATSVLFSALREAAPSPSSSSPSSPPSSPPSQLPAWASSECAHDASVAGRGRQRARSLHGIVLQLFVFLKERHALQLALHAQCPPSQVRSVFPGALVSAVRLATSPSIQGSDRRLRQSLFPQLVRQLGIGRSLHCGVAGHCRFPITAIELHPDDVHHTVLASLLNASAGPSRHGPPAPGARDSKIAPAVTTQSMYTSTLKHVTLGCLTPSILDLLVQCPHLASLQATVSQARWSHVSDLTGDLPHSIRDLPSLPGVAQAMDALLDDPDSQSIDIDVFGFGAAHAHTVTWTFPNLRRLALTSSDRSRSPTILAPMLSRLVLDGVRVSDQQWLAMLGCTESRLKSLVLRLADELQLHSLKMLPRLCPALHTVAISSLVLTSPCAILPPTVTTLTLSSVTMTDASFAALVYPLFYLSSISISSMSVVKPIPTPTPTPSPPSALSAAQTATGMDVWVPSPPHNASTSVSRCDSTAALRSLGCFCPSLVSLALHDTAVPGGDLIFLFTSCRLTSVSLSRTSASTTAGLLHLLSLPQSLSSLSYIRLSHCSGMDATTARQFLSSDALVRLQTARVDVDAVGSRPSRLRRATSRVKQWVAGISSRLCPRLSGLLGKHLAKSRVGDASCAGHGGPTSAMPSTGRHVRLVWNGTVTFLK
ncbi:hypothetical protein BC831DRAFT_506138 [Entophlyctis helioformis]|nr:hypothetical protein BC831DRAFT_506138 [Entophlyctis helioformis]